jgi:hypothetical protein
MSELLGFPITLWDFITFASLMILVFFTIFLLLFIAALPGRIAESRNHPDAEAVKIMGYAGFLAVVPWINAFIWAFKPTEVVDVRRMPSTPPAETEGTAGKTATPEPEPVPAPVQENEKPAAPGKDQ